VASDSRRYTRRSTCTFRHSLFDGYDTAISGSGVLVRAGPDPRVQNASAQHPALTGPSGDELQRIERSPEPPGCMCANLGIPILTMVGNGVILLLGLIFKGSFHSLSEGIAMTETMRAFVIRKVGEAGLQRSPSQSPAPRGRLSGRPRP